ncbi:MAG: PAS domain-containing protein [Melioribacteraceae bacterium]|nr:PAS domain-containing protein [Melioribacteraceae bacterium]
MKHLSKEELEIIFLRMTNAIDEGILILDAARKNLPIIFANEGFCKITDYKPDEVIGKNPRFLAGQDKNTIQLVSDCIKMKKKGSFTLVNYKKDGTKYWSHLTITPIFDSQNNLIYWFNIIRDITIILDTLKSKSETQSMVTTINTISDLINNFLNYLSYFRHSCKDVTNFNKKLLAEFDDIYEAFIRNIRILYSAVKYKEKKLSANFSILDFE